MRAGAKRVIAILAFAGVIVPAIGIGTGMFQARPPVAQEAPRPSGGAAVPVSVAAVKRQDVQIWLAGLGSVQAMNAVQLRSRVDGTLMQVPVTEGQEVKQGDLLAVIDPRPYQAALEAAQARKQQSQAQLASAQSDLSRYTTLAQQEIASRQKLEAVRAQVGQLTAAIAGDDAAIGAAQLNLTFCYITAPFDSRVGLRNVDPGNVVRSAEATPMFSLAQIRPIAVTFTVPQDNLPAIQATLAQAAVSHATLAQSAPAQRSGPLVIAFASDDHTELDRGTLLTLDNAVDPATGTIKLKATFPNAGNRLWPGQFINTRLLLRTDPDELTVPTTAVQHGPAGLYVYVVKPDQTVARQVVEISRDDGRMAVITKGLNEGQTVVTNGQSRLQSGSRVVVNDRSRPAAAKETGKLGG